MAFFLGDRFTHRGNIFNRIGSGEDPVLLGVGLGLANDGLGSTTVLLGFTLFGLGFTTIGHGSANVGTGNRGTGSGSGGGGGVGDNFGEHFWGNLFRLWKETG